MRMKIIAISITLLLITAAGVCRADEGMWPLYDLDKLPFDSLHAMGLTLQPDEIFRPGAGGLSDAAVNLSGGSASFVSPDGLIITNHHVAAGAIQKQSTVEHNYLRDGFYAANDAEEIPAIGYTVNVTVEVKDVTERVLAAVNDSLTDLERYKVIDRAMKEIVAEAEKDRDVKCRVSEMFGGLQYILYTNFQIRDVRIVYAPPEAIGNYGGDIDNWMWPRHVGDFAFLRAYVAPDGSSAAYSKENVAYHPTRFFIVSSEGVREGDFVMMMGFPGRTHRYASSYEIANLSEHYYPMALKTYQDRLAMLEKAAASSPEMNIRLASRISGINNFMKKTLGLYEGFKHSNILDKRRAQEEQLMAYIDGHPNLARKYGHILEQLDSLYREDYKTQEKDHIIGLMTYTCDYLSMAEEIYRWASEREKADLDRDRGYQDRDSTRTKRYLEDEQINLVPSVDKEMLKYLVERALQLPHDQRIATVDKIFGGMEHTDMEAYIDKLYANTGIGDLDRRMQMFHMSREQLDSLHDSFIDFIAQFMPELKARREREKEISGASKRLYPELIQAYAIWKQGNLYPDANGTKRFNWGVVRGFSPRDAVEYKYITTLTGVMEKETGEEPFIVPQRLKEVYLAKDYGDYIDPVVKDVPVDFATTNSGTNGNSGSPVLNGRGELVGLDFDTDYEGVSADYMYDPAVDRAIVCGMRYVLFLLDKVYHLDNLLHELTVH